MWEFEAPGQEDASTSGKQDWLKPGAGPRWCGPPHPEAWPGSQEGALGLQQLCLYPAPPFPLDPPADLQPSDGCPRFGDRAWLSGPGSGWSEAGEGKEGEICGPFVRGHRLLGLTLPSFCHLFNIGDVWEKGVYSEDFQGPKC